MYSLKFIKNEINLNKKIFTSEVLTEGVLASVFKLPLHLSHKGTHPLDHGVVLLIY